MVSEEKNRRVLLAMSGGVDSSAACLLLREQGYEVVGMTMRVWDLPAQFDADATEPRFVLEARALAQRLGIAHHTVDVRADFKADIVRYFIDEYAAGRTPNPCVRCNRHFKFRLMRELADRLGCYYMATGHYVQTQQRDGHTYLLMGSDVRKDQSYFLWRVPQDTLARCLFPLGEMEKPAVRAYLAQKGETAVATKGESMEVCFVTGDYRDFLLAHRPALGSGVAGSFVDTAGRTLGTHRGVPFYTIGQRKGLGIALGEPAYVVRLNPERRTVVLGRATDLLTSCFFIEGLEAVEPRELFSDDAALAVRIRYHSKPSPCRLVRLEDGKLLVRTAQTVSAVTPGQSAVFYIGQRLVGGATIASQRGIGQYATAQPAPATEREDTAHRTL